METADTIEDHGYVFAHVPAGSTELVAPKSSAAAAVRQCLHQLQ
jgi:hypothetical protein